jgi:hypothetical protein
MFIGPPATFFIGSNAYGLINMKAIEKTKLQIFMEFELTSISPLFIILIISVSACMTPEEQRQNAQNIQNEKLTNVFLMNLNKGLKHLEAA